LLQLNVSRHTLPALTDSYHSIVLSADACFLTPPPAAQGAKSGANDADRFDYNKDPISWFYQVSNLSHPTHHQQAHGCMRHCKAAGRISQPTHVCSAHDELVSQNQIKSEEQFQAKKSELRAAALERLETIFDKKGKVRVRGQHHLRQHSLSKNCDAVPPLSVLDRPAVVYEHQVAYTRVYQGVCMCMD
jgi:hypothetical protein